MDLAYRFRRRLAGAVVWLSAATASLAAPVSQTIPFSNGFDYAAGTPVSALTNDGWDASSPSVVVQTSVVWNGTAAVELPASTVLSNAVVAAALTNVWTESYLRLEPQVDTNAPAVRSNAVALVKLGEAGYLLAYDRLNGWLTLSNTAWGGDAAMVTNGQWVRVTICQDYVAHRCAVFQDGQLLKERLPFVNTNVNVCSSFRFESGSSGNSYLDDVSIGRTFSATLTNDWNGMGLTDAQEIEAYGYLAFTLNVGPGETYTTLQSAVDAALPQYTINVADGSYTEDITIAQNLAGLTGTAFTVDGTVNIGPGAVVKASGFTSGNLGVSAVAGLYLAGALTANNVTIGMDGVLTGTAFTVNGVLTLDTGAMMRADTLTCIGDLSVGANGVLTVAGALSAGDVTVGTGGLLTAGVFTNDSLSIAAGAVVRADSMICSGDLTITGAGSLFVAGAASASNVTVGVGGVLTAGVFTVSGTLGIAAGAVMSVSGLTCPNLSISNSGTLIVSGALVTPHLAIAPGGVVVITNGSLQADGQVLTGSFTLDERWGNQQARSTLTFQDDFETYPVGTPLSVLGFRGWGASDSLVAVESTRKYSGAKAVDVTYATSLSNRVNSGGAVQVWTDFRGILCFNANDEVREVRSSAAFMMVVSTNGYLSVYNRTNSAWEVCTKDVWGVSVPPLTNGQWSRISVANNYATKKCAVFMNGVLLRQGFPFINTNLTGYSTMTVANQETNALCLDDVYIGAQYPPSLTNDVNHNGIPDAREITLTDDITRSGNVFRFR